MKHRQVAVILHSTSPYQRKTLLGIGAYAAKTGNGDSISKSSRWQNSPI